MKALLIALGVAGLIALSGCSDGDGNVDLSGNANNGNVDDGNGGGGNAGDLQTFVINNCMGATGGDAVDIDGRMFPADSTVDPTQSIYTAECLN